jgi:prepilin-type N-terminal cleavage/methylation domain-containing protein
MISWSAKVKRGFTLIELVICVAIFAMMTALLVAKYGAFNQSVLLTNLAYDTAITIRTAQTYGLSGQGQEQTTCPNSICFKYPYGVHFSTSLSENTKITLFADSSPLNAPNGTYEAGDTEVSVYTITRGAIVSGMCVGDGCSEADGTTQQLDITFVRPNPEAKICVDGSTSCPTKYARIFIKGTDNSLRSVVVRSTGQVSVQE